MTVRQTDMPVRLRVNLALDVAAALRYWARRKGISHTEAIRRAIAFWNFIETERGCGNTLVVVERHWYGDRVREVEWVD